MPDVVRFACDCERFGAQGITVHPRPDERHIRRNDVAAIRRAIGVEFNIEGYPSADFVRLVCDAHPAQVTLVPDAPSQLTSNHGWDVLAHRAELEQLIPVFHAEGIRVSIFVDADPEMVRAAAALGADRVELYTGPYAEQFPHDPKGAIEAYRPAAEAARDLHIGLNMGHDLNLDNLAPLLEAFPWVDECSIGHALICDALYLGIEETIARYRKLCHLFD